MFWKAYALNLKYGTFQLNELYLKSKTKPPFKVIVWLHRMLSLFWSPSLHYQQVPMARQESTCRNTGRQKTVYLRNALCRSTQRRGSGSQSSIEGNEKLLAQEYRMIILWYANFYFLYLEFELASAIKLSDILSVREWLTHSLHICTSVENNFPWSVVMVVCVESSTCRRPAEGITMQRHESLHDTFCVVQL